MTSEKIWIALVAIAGFAMGQSSLVLVLSILIAAEAHHSLLNAGSAASAVSVVSGLALISWRFASVNKRKI